MKLLRYGPDVGVHVFGVAQPLDALLHAMGSDQENAGQGHFGLRLALDDPSIRRFLAGNATTGATREEFGFIHRVDHPESVEKVRLYNPLNVNVITALLTDS